ncbi:hypothetical protein [Stenotrophomonas phage BUCT555]|nr:hypothetical protein [Stenotrophomonas phage BUCT555]
MNAIELLDAMDTVLDEPKKWTKGEYARIADGTGTWATDGEATCWCMAGAMAKAEGFPVESGNPAGKEAGFYLLQAANELHPPRENERGEVRGKWWSYANFNDAPSTDYIRVKAVISRARQLLKSHQKEENA